MFCLKLCGRCLNEQVLPFLCARMGIPPWLVNAEQLSPGNLIMGLNLAQGLSHNKQNTAVSLVCREELQPKGSHPALALSSGEDRFP